MQAYRATRLGVGFLVSSNIFAVFMWAQLFFFFLLCLNFGVPNVGLYVCVAYFKALKGVM